VLATCVLYSILKDLDFTTGLGFCIRSSLILILSFRFAGFAGFEHNDRFRSCHLQTTCWKLHHLLWEIWIPISSTAPFTTFHNSKYSTYAYSITTTYQILYSRKTFNHSIDTIPDYISGTSFHFYCISASYVVSSRNGNEGCDGSLEGSS